MMRELQYPFDNGALLRKKRALKRKCLEQFHEWLDIRVAILGGSTTTDIRDILELFLLNEGIRPIFYESEYGKYFEDSVYPNAMLEEFKPQIVFIHTSMRNIRHIPTPFDTEEMVDEKLEAEWNDLEKMWNHLERRFGCVIIQNNFERPLYRGYGNQDIADFHGFSNFISRLNQKIYAYKQSHKSFYVHDIEGLSARYGLRKWLEPRYWYLYRYSLNMDAIPELAYSLYTIIKSLLGKNKKLLVLDADNTLWGGVVGEDGVEKLELGMETASGQAFLEWQAYIKGLQEKGVLLAIASKNEMQSVLDGIHHPSGILKENDFSFIKADWGNKDDSVSFISKELNLGLNQIVFADDNPVERDLLEQRLEQVEVVKESKPDRFVQYLDEAGYFELTTLTEEDMARQMMYAANAQRLQHQGEFSDYGAYLRSLQMKACLHGLEPLYLSRITQLINKTNQFNLTTRRYTESEVASMMKDDAYITIYGRLTDKFGDNGIVSVLIAHGKGVVIHIQLLILSCRVFKRGMEYAMLDSLVKRCRARGVESIKGYFCPTAKNSLVKEFYQSVGFHKESEDEEGNSVWSLLVEEYEDRNHVIKVQEEI